MASADGSALAIALMDETSFDLGVGDYNVTLTGTVKGNAASTADIPFSVTQQITVVSPGCSAQQL